MKAIGDPRFADFDTLRLVKELCLVIESTRDYSAKKVN
jgi:hypothetical protein